MNITARQIARMIQVRADCLLETGESCDLDAALLEAVGHVEAAVTRFKLERERIGAWGREERAKITEKVTDVRLTRLSRRLERVA